VSEQAERQRLRGAIGSGRRCVPATQQPSASAHASQTHLTSHPLPLRTRYTPSAERHDRAGVHLTHCRPPVPASARLGPSVIRGSGDLIWRRGLIPTAEAREMASLAVARGKKRPRKLCTVPRTVAPRLRRGGAREPGQRLDAPLPSPATAPMAHDTHAVGKHRSLLGSQSMRRAAFSDAGHGMGSLEGEGANACPCQAPGPTWYVARLLHLESRAVWLMRDGQWLMVNHGPWNLRPPVQMSLFPLLSCSCWLFLLRLPPVARLSCPSQAMRPVQ
jgi:hypothetical protein